MLLRNYCDDAIGRRKGGRGEEGEVVGCRLFSWFLSRAAWQSQTFKPADYFSLPNSSNLAFRAAVSSLSY